VEKLSGLQGSIRDCILNELAMPKNGRERFGAKRETFHFRAIVLIVPVPFSQLFCHGVASKTAWPRK